jgi:hypothetical protein
MSENDNDTSKPAEENPWYVLATIHKGIIPVEGTTEFQSWLNAFSSREVWNSWAISKLNDKQKKFIREKKPDIFDESPPWDSIKKDVQKRLQQRGVESIPALELAMDMSSLNFVDDAHFARFIFPAKVIFSDSIFTKIADFEHAVFFNYAGFTGCQFLSDSDFSHVSFSWVNFQKAIFSQDVFFTDAAFQKADFIRAIFEKTCSFVRSRFNSDCYFDFCHFKNTPTFREVMFKKEYPTLTCTIFHEKITLSTNKAINWPDPQNCEQNPEVAKVTCEVLREQMETQGLHDEAHFFFRRERHFAVKMLTPWQRLPNNLFACLSAYGFSLKRPLGALALLWALPMLIFWVNICTGKCANTIGAELWVSLIKMAGLSIANIFQITGLQRVYWSDFIECLPWGLKFLGGAQTLLAIPLLFLLLLGLRNRFRLK